MAYGDITQTRLTNFKVSWNGTYLGFVDKVSPNIKIITKPIKVGSMGDIALGSRVIGAEGVIRVEFRESIAALLTTLTPWAGADKLLVPARGDDLYDYAALLTLHPEDLPDASKDEDLNFLKAVPNSPFLLERDGLADDKIVAEFAIFPDRAQLPELVYAHLGPVPAA